MYINYDGSCLAADYIEVLRAPKHKVTYDSPAATTGGQVMVATVRCEEIVNEKLAELVSSPVRGLP